MAKPLQVAPRSRKKSRELSKTEISEDSRLAKLFSASDKKEVDAFFRLGAIEGLSEEEQAAHAHEAIGDGQVPVMQLYQNDTVMARP